MAQLSAHISGGVQRSLAVQERIAWLLCSAFVASRCPNEGGADADMCYDELYAAAGAYCGSMVVTRQLVNVIGHQTALAKKGKFSRLGLMGPIRGLLEFLLGRGQLDGVQAVLDD